MNITHGIDIIQLNREELKDLSFAKRFMTINEYKVFLSLGNNFDQQKRYTAAIWSLKEAIIKATNHKFLFSKIEINLNNDAAPKCNIDNINLSLSYEIDYIIGSAIYIKND